MTETMEAAAPLTPADADLRDFKFMALDVQRLRDSDLAGHQDAEVFRCGVLSWCAAWQQQPAGSLPDDDAALARLLGYGRDVVGFQRVREAGGLRGWVKCSDGRLYHPVVAEKVNEAWLRKQEVIDEKAAARERKRQQRAEQRKLGQTPGDANEQQTVLTDSTCPMGQEAVSHGTEGDVTRDNGGRPMGQTDLSAGNRSYKTGQDRTRQDRDRTGPVEQLQLAVEAWNDMARRHGLPVCEKLTDGRRRALGARLKEAGHDGWGRAVALVSQSDLMLGKRPPKVPGQKPWRCTFDWLISDTNFHKVVEGQYADKPSAPVVTRAPEQDFEAVAQLVRKRIETPHLNDDLVWGAVTAGALGAEEAEAAGWHRRGQAA